MKITYSIAVALSSVTQYEGITSGDVPLMHSVNCSSEEEAKELFELVKGFLDSVQKKLGDSTT